MTLLKRQQLEDATWHLVVIMNQILNLCASLDFVSFCHIPREWNGVVDCLAKWASNHLHDWNIMERVQLPLDFSQTLDQLVKIDRAV